MSKGQTYQKWYIERRAERIAYSTQWAKDSREFKRALLDSIKMQIGCADCGFDKHPFAMDFDHCEGTKEYTLGSTKLLDRKIDTILEELSKCDVVCANCHRIRTYERYDK